MLPLELPGVNTFDAQGGQEPLHVGVALVVPHVPELNGQLALEAANEIHIHPDAREVFQSAAGDDDAPLLRVGMATGRERLDEATGQLTVGFDHVVPGRPAARPRARRGGVDEANISSTGIWSVAAAQWVGRASSSEASRVEVVIGAPN
jgi:hypothetical protein